MFDAKFKLQFFDRQSVTDPAEKAAVRVQSKFGAYVMRAARKSIKNKDGASKPGQPPHAHLTYRRADGRGVSRVRYLFRDSILFGRTPQGSVVVGPLFRQGSRTRPTIPQVLEHGGVSTLYGKRSGKPISIAARPFMRPALERELPKFAELFRGSIGG